MFNIKRIKEGENSFIVTTDEGSVSIVGTGDFVVRMVKAVCESDEFVELVRKNLEGVSREDIAVEMRLAGFPEQIIIDFENGDFWADIIKTDSSNGR